MFSGCFESKVVDGDADLKILELLKQLQAKDECAPIMNADDDADTEKHVESITAENSQSVVYCNGVWDMCHMGHQRLFQRAATNGKLIVGVHGDEACKGYKRPPIMTADERATQVAGCKGVWKVLKNAPLETITQEFMEKYKIDKVALGEEYLLKDVKDDKWYAYPRESGKFVALSRTEGISTSDLIKRCADVQADVRADKQAA
jgi:cytidyltransferase-like protein